jgi:hypothetical protein
MFAIAPQTVMVDGVPVVFGNEGDDVSKCLMKVGKHTLRFHRHGAFIEHLVEEPPAEDEPEDPAVLAEREREQMEADKANQHELKTADDTTAADLSNDAPVHEVQHDGQ